MAHDRARGVSTPEWAVVLGLVILFVSVVVPGYHIWKSRQRLIMARFDVSALSTACRDFFKEYDQWPTSLSGGLEDARYGRDLPNREVMNVLTAVAGPGNTGHRVNKRRIAYLAIPAAGKGVSGLDGEGNFIDPWGQPYQFLLDASLDNNCLSRDTIYGNRQNEGVLIWSCGPDGLSDTVDDLTSWSR